MLPVGRSHVDELSPRRQAGVRVERDQRTATAAGRFEIRVGGIGLGLRGRRRIIGDSTSLDLGEGQDGGPRRRHRHRQEHPNQ